jgi:hypothetical protein
MLTPRARVFTLTVLAMLAFAGNSLLCRIALDDTSIDPASFTAARLISAAPPLGAAALMLLGGVAWGVYSLRGSAAADPAALPWATFCVRRRCPLRSQRCC